MREMGRHLDARPRTFAAWETGSGGPVAATAIRKRNQFYDRWIGGRTTEWLVRSSSRRKITGVIGGHMNILTPFDTTIGPRARDAAGMRVGGRRLTRRNFLQALLRSCGRRSRLRESAATRRLRAALVPGGRAIDSRAFESGQRLDIGEHGDVHYRKKPNGRVAASAYFRNAQRVRRRIEATGDSKASARRRLFAALGEAMAAGGPGYSPRSTFADVAADWLESLDELVAAGRRSPRTVALYRHALARHVLPGLGGLRLSELTSGADGPIHPDRRRTAGYSVAKLSHR